MKKIMIIFLVNILLFSSSCASFSTGAPSVDDEITWTTSETTSADSEMALTTSETTSADSEMTLTTSETTDTFTTALSVAESTEESFVPVTPAPPFVIPPPHAIINAPDYIPHIKTWFELMRPTKYGYDHPKSDFFLPNDTVIQDSIGFIKPFERELSVSDFEKLESGVTFRYVCELLGDPDGMVIGEPPEPFYFVSDGGYVRFHMRWDSYDAYFDMDNPVFFWSYIDENGVCAESRNLWNISLPDGQEARYKVNRPERSLKVDAFVEKVSALRVGMNEFEILSVLGAHDGAVDDGFFYVLEDGSMAVVQMEWIKTDGYLSDYMMADVYFLNADGTHTSILPAASD